MLSHALCACNARAGTTSVSVVRQVMVALIPYVWEATGCCGALCCITSHAVSQASKETNTGWRAGAGALMSLQCVLRRVRS